MFTSTLSSFEMFFEDKHTSMYLMETGFFIYAKYVHMPKMNYSVITISFAATGNPG